MDSEAATYLCIRRDRQGPAPHLLAQGLVASRGGRLVAMQPRGAAISAVAEFRSAIDATLVALDIAGSTASVNQHVATRMTLSTSDDSASRPDAGSRQLQRVRRWFDGTGATVLATASVAGMVAPALPPWAELVHHRDSDQGRRHRPERIYELRATQLKSNLGWAYRAATQRPVGRAPAIEQLGAAWSATLHGDPRTVQLEGERGIGKTAVAAELALHAHAKGALVLYGHGDPDGSPLSALGEAIDTVHAPGRRSMELLPARDQREILEAYGAFAAWLDGLASERPVLLVLDDLDQTTRAARLLVDGLHHAARAAPWMLVTTARHAGPDPGGDRGCTGPERIRLPGLPPTEVARLVEQTLGCRLPPDDEGVAWLTSATAGNPLFVLQALRGLPDAPDVGAGLLAARRHLPERLVEVIRWRLAQLPAPTHRLLADIADIAYAGGAADLDLIADVAARPPLVVRRELEPAVGAELLRAGPDGTYAFTHDVVRRAMQRDELWAWRSRCSAT